MFFYYCFGVITLYICMFGLFVLFLCLCIALDYQFVVMPLLRLSDGRCWLESLYSGIVYSLPSNILRRSWHALFWNKHCLLYYCMIGWMFGILSLFLVCYSSCFLPVKWIPVSEWWVMHPAPLGLWWRAGLRGWLRWTALP